ncbi:AAA family ATPase [Variovorax atrisoli]|uniref:AAA family ATPase n=1 Tax=Variovorax atrisoli TaxID=3394203 RepID=UPI004040392A
MSTLIQVGRIDRIFIQGLFGFFTYDIPLRGGHFSNDDSASILYGDNGCGKTTLLKLIFNLLSSRTGRGEKTFVARTPFKRLKITFSNGTVVAATKTEELTGSYVLDIEVPNSGSVSFNFAVNTEGTIGSGDETIAALSVLRTLDIQLLFLTDSRNIMATTSYFEGPNKFSTTDDFAYQRWTTIERTRSIRKDEGARPFDVELMVARLRNAIREEVFRGSRDGETNANSTYIDLLERLAAPWQTLNTTTKSLEDLSERVEEIASKGEKFAEFGVASSIPQKRILRLISSAPVDRFALLRNVLEPYLDGIEARLEALQDVHTLISDFVRVTQGFLGPKKRITFSIKSGLQILDRTDHPVQIEHLSSGEKHLLMLLCTTVIAREQATIFLIDEPELSLNIKWQRMLVDALQVCAAGSSIQFIVASHSLELLSKYRAQTIKMEDMDE